MNWDDLRFFLAVVDHGSVSGAARALGVEHTTVARRLAALESDLQSRLFDRLPKAWTLTEQGRALVEPARAVERSMHAFRRSSDVVSAAQHSVRVSAPPTLASHFLVPRMAPLLAGLDGISLEFVGEHRKADLARREADIALRMSRPAEATLAVRRVASIRFGLYGAPDYLARTPPAHWQFVGYGDGLAHVTQQAWLRAVAGERRFALRCNDMVALLHAACAGIGVAALPVWLGDATPMLERVDTCPASAELWMAMHEDVRLAPHVRAVADALASLFEDQSIFSHTTSPVAPAPDVGAATR